ncbi:hypothetical protein DESUT3_26960 [Desulfuromonas versatilis]|uniref:VacJ family lipoprotein n=1 Tax=Desulfuromonas versatilis TaxID=2802975 RepID=A0ABN6DZQ0_9BACT|nr:VacJ family lipoprotein [Desulfuromonas versatilis]BCR05627.1 hypothetical protein DESUT3_26960 [Desulfuromonas versatilis]
MKPAGKLVVLLLLVALTALCPAARAQDVFNPTGAGAPSAPADLEADELFEEEPLEVWDPIEPFNRGMFWFNDKLYFYLLKPVARGYRAVAPEPVRTSVGNFFSNLAFPVRFVNSALQLKIGDAGNELRRFLLNSTVGVAGLFDPAKQNGWLKKEEDLGQTFGRYGVGSGFYLVMPVFGPTNLRDGVGRLGDGYLDPVPFLVPGTLEYVGVKAYDRVNALSLDKDTYEGIKREQLDPYLFIRNAYTQRREALIEK